jgi:hypothetical protein
MEGAVIIATDLIIITHTDLLIGDLYIDLGGIF